MTLEERLERIESKLDALLQREVCKENYEVEEFAKQVGKAPFTVREWCRNGRIHATKRMSGRGAHTGWTISHEELLRYQREGILPIRGRDPKSPGTDE